MILSLIGDCTNSQKPFRFIIGIKCGIQIIFSPTFYHQKICQNSPAKCVWHAFIPTFEHIGVVPLLLKISDAEGSLFMRMPMLLCSCHSHIQCKIHKQNSMPFLGRSWWVQWIIKINGKFEKGIALWCFACTKKKRAIDRWSSAVSLFLVQEIHSSTLVIQFFWKVCAHNIIKPSL